MKAKHWWAMVAAVALLGGCAMHNRATDASLPPAPDYSASTQWWISQRGADVDVFYIISTETTDYVKDGDTCHYADTYNDSLRRLMADEMVNVDPMLAGQLNYYSPYYRQCTMEAFVSEEVMRERMPLAASDVRRAFDYYLRHLNHGRPFVLAGFSQGAALVVDLLKQMADSTYSRMVAAYVVGYKVTANDTLGNNHLRAARDSADLGVTICYNSVRDNSCAIPLLSEGNCMSINPVNWRTDAEAARLADHKGGDSLTVRLDTNSLLLHIDGYSRTDYMLPLIGCEGNYHCLDLVLYYPYLRHNIVLRAEHYVQQQLEQQKTLAD